MRLDCTRVVVKVVMVILVKIDFRKGIFIL